MLLSAIVEYFSPNDFGCGLHSNAHVCAVHLLTRYEKGLIGALFDPRGDEPWWDPYSVRASDLFAVSALSVPRFTWGSFLKVVVPVFEADAEASQTCLSGCSGDVSCLLRQVEPKASIFDQEAKSNLDRMNDIWSLIRRDPILMATRGFGDAGLSKLLARKRPHLVPILDHVSHDRLRRKNGRIGRACAWCSIREEYNSAFTLRDSVATIRSEAGVPSWISDLPVIDIVVRMRDIHGCDARVTTSAGTTIAGSINSGSGE